MELRVMNKLKAIEEETKQYQMRAQYKDQLAKKRYEEQLVQQQRSQEEILKKQEESLAKQEALRRATMEHEIELREMHKLKAIEAEAMARAMEETKQNQMSAQYQDQLAKNRDEEQLMQQQRSQEDNLKKQEESLAMQEALRRSTIIREMEFRQKNRLMAIRAEVRARAKAERENRAISLEQIRQINAAENWATIQENITAQDAERERLVAYWMYLKSHASMMQNAGEDIVEGAIIETMIDDNMDEVLTSAAVLHVDAVQLEDGSIAFDLCRTTYY